jgi:anhydro-N-acetylmuramic acid kinase
MIKESYNVIGVMSGTSLDGIDLAHINLREHAGKWDFEIYNCETVSYSAFWVERLKQAVSFSAPALEQLNTDYTLLLTQTISVFIKKHNIEDLDAVCSHGHTVLHQPTAGITLQIGNLPQISELTGQTVVCDFRIGDVKLGGQGAPLVPIGDRLLFAGYDYCLNLGGFSNVSFDEKGKRIAFDISPVNTVLNHYSNLLGKEYDDGGKISASGDLDEELLHQLNTLEFYKMMYPKSLGFEFVKDIVLPLIEHSVASTTDKMRTFTEHIALQTSLALPAKEGKMLITGGGAYNDFLIGRIKYYLPHVEIVIPERKILEYKEALIFALLGVLKLRDENNVLSSVTGAAQDHSSGIIFWNKDLQS